MFADYDNEISGDSDIEVELNYSADLQLMDSAVQMNHVFNKVNGDFENDLDAVKDTKQHIVTANAVRRQSSVDGTIVGPVNGLKTHEQNMILQRMAVVEVKKPGKGSKCCWCKNIPTYFVNCVYIIIIYSLLLCVYMLSQKNPDLCDILA